MVLFDYVIREWDGAYRNVAISWGNGTATIRYKDGNMHKVSAEYAESIINHRIDPNWAGDAVWSNLP